MVAVAPTLDARSQVSPSYLEPVEVMVCPNRTRSITLILSQYNKLLPLYAVLRFAATLTDGVGRRVNGCSSRGLVGFGDDPGRSADRGSWWAIALRRGEEGGEGRRGGGGGGRERRGGGRGGGGGGGGGEGGSPHTALRQLPDPQLPHEDWVITRPRLTGVCGSDSKQILMDFGEGRRRQRHVRLLFLSPSHGTRGSRRRGGDGAQGPGAAGRSARSAQPVAVLRPARHRAPVPHAKAATTACAGASPTATSSRASTPGCRPT